MKKSITLATNNPHKKTKLAWIVEPYFSEVHEQPSSIDVEETEGSFLGNAKLKAIELSKIQDGYAVATDGGVLIPALGEQWNSLLTRRFLGHDNVTDWDRIEGILALMKDKKGSERDMFWREALALAYRGKVIFSCEAEGDHSRMQETYNTAQYRPGIWLCTLTYYPQFNNKNFFELTDQETAYAETSWHVLRDKTQGFLKNYMSS